VRLWYIHLFWPIVNDLNAIFSQHKVNNVHLFASACTAEFKDSSDKDFLMEMEAEADPVGKGERLWSLYYQIKELLQCEIGLVNKADLKNQYLKRS